MAVWSPEHHHRPAQPRLWLPLRPNLVLSPGAPLHHFSPSESPREPLPAVGLALALEVASLGILRA